MRERLPPEAISADPNSVTGAYLSGRRAIELPAARREPKGRGQVLGAKEHNLKNVDVTIPLGVPVCVALHRHRVSSRPLRRAGGGERHRPSRR